MGVFYHFSRCHLISKNIPPGGFHHNFNIMIIDYSTLCNQPHFLKKGGISHYQFKPISDSILFIVKMVHRLCHLPDPGIREVCVALGGPDIGVPQYLFHILLGHA